jgi:uncharacterized protein (DUF1697 family)
VYICFTRKKPDQAAVNKLLGYRNDIDDFQLHGREVYWLCRKSLSDSKFSGALLERILGGPATARNVNTVNRLVAKYE